MKIIICGAGEVAFSLAKYLASENMQVTVIDEDIDKLHKMSLPIDHAMDRDWLLSLRSLSISPAPVYLKEELHEGNSYIQAKSEFKYSFYRRYFYFFI